MLQQLAAEEKLRADGGSGLKQIRADVDGPETYYVNGHSGGSVGAIHDHSNSQITIGQGEGQFVLNGVEFRTRHNDYALRMPTKSTSAYHVLSEIPYPQVPPEVTEKSTVQEQIEEMREWFKAWRDQNYKVRDYRPYFKPILCYLEGAWTTKTKEIEESFFSSRHALDADSWFDLQYRKRNYYFSRALQSITFHTDQRPLFVSLLKRKKDTINSYFNSPIFVLPDAVIFSLSNVVREMFLYVLTLHVCTPQMSRGARFTVVGPSDKRFTSTQYLDSMMREVPGKDNYAANITDNSFGMTFLDPTTPNNTALNVGYYHRRYKGEKADAMGLSYGRRGYSDPNVFMAETTQPGIAAMYLKQCSNKLCYESRKRMSYAIPLEVIYLTPLTSWNPYELIHVSDRDKNFVTNGGKRNGGFRNQTAFNGTFSGLYYRTPTEFFSGGEVGSSPADTVKGSVGVLDKNGTVRSLSASGIRIFLPNIPGVGVLRTRYPITPIHGESSGVWKELNALKDIVMKLSSNEKFLVEKVPRAPLPTTTAKPTTTTTRTTTRTSPSSTKSTTATAQQSSATSARPSTTRPVTLPKAYPIQPQLTLVLSTTSRNPPGEHSHSIELTKDEQERLQRGEIIGFITSQDNSHSHEVKVQFSDNRYHIVSCDARSPPCWDGHTSCLTSPTEYKCPAEETVSLTDLLTKATDA
ncbi:unnamed protein product [Lymnaea stagnalis]|uniref:Uncharacterized protein n=1 Tax=Lymnaea stagnalis TaxID=6523 RepID=A0AAV2INS3_LYMST